MTTDTKQMRTKKIMSNFRGGLIPETPLNTALDGGAFASTDFGLAPPM